MPIGLTSSLLGYDAPTAAIPLPAITTSIPNLSQRIDPTTGKANFTRTGMAGVLDRVGDFIGSDQGRAALLRSAGATLDGGLGAGIKAGADYVDHQKAIAAGAAQQGFENALATRKEDIAALQGQQKNDLGWAGIDVDLRGLRERTRAAQAQEGIATRGQNVTMRGQDVDRANNTDSNAVRLTTNAADNATSRANNAASTGASIYGANLDYMGKAAGIGSKGGYSETETKLPGTPAVAPGWFSSGTPATPTVTTTTRAPIGAAPAAGGATPLTPPAAAIAALKANPNLRGQFEAKYGVGSASQHLGGR